MPFHDTDPKVYPFIFEITADQFSSTGESVELVPNPAFHTDTNARIVDVTIFKEIPFDNGAELSIGNYTVAGSRDRLASMEEVDAQTAGISKPTRWRDSDGYGVWMIGQNARLFTRLTGGVPTTGLIRVILSVVYMSPRSVLI